MDVADAKSPAPDTATEMLEGGIRALVRRNRSAVAAELVTEPSEDALIAGATSIADIDKLIGELETARDYLQSEGERVRHMTARYAHLAQTASASVKIIAESLGKWRSAGPISQEHAPMPRAHTPNLSPVDDGEPPNRTISSAGFQTASEPPPRPVFDALQRQREAQQLRQLGDVGGDAPGLIAGSFFALAFALAAIRDWLT